MKMSTEIAERSGRFEILYTTDPKNKQKKLEKYLEMREHDKRATDLEKLKKEEELTGKHKRKDKVIPILHSNQKTHLLEIETRSKITGIKITCRQTQRKRRIQKAKRKHSEHIRAFPGLG